MYDSGKTVEPYLFKGHVVRSFDSALCPSSSDISTNISVIKEKCTGVPSLLGRRLRTYRSKVCIRTDTKRTLQNTRVCIDPKYRTFVFFKFLVNESCLQPSVIDPRPRVF